MADSNITCSGLTATSGVGQVALQWSTLLPSEVALPYLALGAVEVWAASSNDRGAAAKIGETNSGLFVHAGLSGGAQRWYWVRPRNASGAYGDWFPFAATNGVAATAGTSQPGPGSITATELAPDAVTQSAIAPAAVGTTELESLAVTRQKLGFGAVGTLQVEDGAITNAKIQFLTADKIVASSLSAISANLGTVTAGTITGVTINGVTINSTTINGGVINGGQILGMDGIYGAVITSQLIRVGVLQKIEMHASTGEIYFWDNTGTFNGRIGTFSRGAPVIDINTNFPSSFVARFRNGSASAVEGLSPSFAFYASQGAFGPFTGAHDALWPRDLPLPAIGDLIADDGVLFRHGVSDALCRACLPEERRPALGVLAAEMELTQPTAAMPDHVDLEGIAASYRLILVNAVGEGLINVCDAGGPIEAGTLLVASPVAGKAMAQHDDLLRAATVARARESATFDASGRAQIACIYLSG